MGFFWPQHDPPTQTRLPSSWHQQAATYAEIRCLQWQLAIALLVSMCLFDCVNWCPSLIFVLSHSFFQMLTINFTIHFPTFPTFAQLFQHLPTVPTFTRHLPYISHTFPISSLCHQKRALLRPFLAHDLSPPRIRAVGQLEPTIARLKKWVEARRSKGFHKENYGKTWGILKIPGYWEWTF